MNSATVSVAIYVLAAVLASMTILVLLVRALVWIGQRGDRSPDQHAGQPEDDVVAVLAAAATTALGKPARIHRVHLVRDAAHPRWARAGRMDIMLSHRVEPRR